MWGLQTEARRRAERGRRCWMERGHEGGESGRRAGGGLEPASAGKDFHACWALG